MTKTKSGAKINIISIQREETHAPNTLAKVVPQLLKVSHKMKCQINEHIVSAPLWCLHTANTATTQFAINMEPRALHSS